MVESDFKKFFWKCFTGVTDSNFLVTLKLTDDSIFVDEIKKKVADNINFLRVNYFVMYCEDLNNYFCGALILDKDKTLATTNKVEKIKGEPKEGDINAFID